MSSLLQRALGSLVTRGALEVVTAQGARFVVGDEASASLAIRFTDTRAQWALLFDPEMQLGELYMAGRWVVERGTLYEVMALLINNLQNVENAKPNRWLEIIDRLRFAHRRRNQRNDRRRSESNVAHHYDLGESLYDLFLDAGRQYSCAYFEHPDQTLEEAQLAKKRHIAAKLHIQPG